MKGTVSVLLIFLLFASCHNRPGNNESIAIKKAVMIENSQVVEKVTDEWVNSFPNNIRKIKSQFKRMNVSKYNCSIIDEFYSDYGTKVDTKDLIQLDSITFSELFGSASKDLEDYCESYLYSIERPFLGLYPITLIKYFGVVERPLMLVLFDSNGKYLNSIEIADSYGETGGCLSSKFSNDSTMIQEFEWYDYGVDSIGNDVWETTYQTQTVIFKRNGEFEIKNIARN